MDTNTNQNQTLATLQNELTATLADRTMGSIERADAVLRIRRAISRHLRTEGSPAGLGLTGLCDLTYR